MGIGTFSVMSAPGKRALARQTETFLSPQISTFRLC